MVKEVEAQGRRYFYCESCKLLYEDKKWAEECERGCKKNKTCDLGITRHSIKKILEKI